MMQSNGIAAAPGDLLKEHAALPCIGQGIGMPHAMLGGLREPAAVLAVLKHPIPYHTPDEQTVDVVLAIIWPRDGSSDFLNALARFCRHLSHPQVLKKVRAATSAEEVLQHLGEPKDVGCPSISGQSTLATPRKPGITMPELASRLEAERKVQADPVVLSRFLCRHGFTYTIKR